MLKISKEIPIESLVARQMTFWENVRRKKEKAKIKSVLPCITISREIGSQGAKLAQQLAQRLGWQVFDKEIVDYIASNAKVRTGIVELFDGKTRSELDNWMLTILDKHTLSSDKFFKHLVTTVMSIGQHGKAVILGRGANFILPDERALKIRVIAPAAQRVASVCAETGESAAKAEALIRKMQNERSAFVKRYFHAKAEDGSNYDLVINMGKVSLAAAEEIAVAALAAKFGLQEKALRGKEK